MTTFEKIFPTDVLTKRQRVERTLNFQPVDRVVLHDQLSYNPGVIAVYTAKPITGFSYTRADVGTVIRKTLDACFLPVNPLGTGQIIDTDGFVYQNDEWNSSLIKRPFSDVAGARSYLLRKTEELVHAPFDSEQERQQYHAYMHDLQDLVGETVVIDFSIGVGFCDCWSNLGLDLFSYLHAEDPQVIKDYVAARTARSVCKVHAVADVALSPIVLIAEDFASKNGSIFNPLLLSQVLFPNLLNLTNAWHAHGIKVLYHSDGNWKQVIPDLMNCAVDGFYCLEPALGMDIVELRRSWLQHTWAGGVDGVDLMERGTPEDVRHEVHRIIQKTDALNTGGIFIGSSSEINPPIQPQNFRAMVEAVGEIFNPSFST
jgi:hypothetical protein